MTLADFRFSRRTRRTLAALIPVVCAGDAEAFAEPILDEVEAMVRSIPGFMRVGLLLGLALFAWSALLRGGRFSRLPLPRREAHFRRWWTSRINLLHQLAKNVSGLLNFAYYEQPEVRARLAYHPDRWIAEVARRRLARFSDDIQAHDALVTAPDPLVRLRTKP